MFSKPSTNWIHVVSIVCLQKKLVIFDMRTQKLEQPKRRTTTIGLRIWDPKLWNLLASEYSEVNVAGYVRMKFLMKSWAEPNHNPAQRHYI